MCCGLRINGTALATENVFFLLFPDPGPGMPELAEVHHAYA